MLKTRGAADQPAVPDPRTDAPSPDAPPSVEQRRDGPAGGPSVDATPMSAGMLTTLFMHLPGGVIVLDTGGREIFANEAGTRLRREMMLGPGSVAAKALSGDLDDLAPVAHGVLISRALAGDPVPDVDYVLGVQGEAQHRVVQVAFTPLRDATNLITGVVLTLTDLTERVDGQATLARAAEALAQLTRETLAREAGTLARKAVSQAQDNRDLTRSNSDLEEQAMSARAADALAEVTRATLARIAITQAQDNRDLTRSNLELEQQATLARAADTLAEVTRETLARIAAAQAQDNRDLTRSNTELEQQATLARAADALAEVTRETLARIAITQAQDNRDLTRSNSELEQQATLARAADALAEVTRATLAREAGTLALKAVTQAQDNRDLTRSNSDLEHQATLARVADALAEVTRETLARKAGILARKAVTQAQDNRDLTRSNMELEQQATLARAADALAQVTRETLAREAGTLARKAVTQAQDNRDLTRSNTGLEQFASVASHDLQEPLRKIQAFGDRLKSVDGAALSVAGADYLDRMQHAAARMQVLINDLLTYARMSAEPPALGLVDLAAITQAVLTDLETRVAQSGGQVEVGALPTIEGDPLRLRQLLQNLISNALKFQRPGMTPIVTVSAVLLPWEDAEHSDLVANGSAPSWLHLTVQDNGIGFEQKHAERIFEVFKRLHGRSAYEGTGIGLALCRQIVEQHGGHIAATGAPGQGATIVVTLPLRQTEGGGIS